MTHRFDRLQIGGTTPGTARSVAVHRFGTPGARPKAYIQGGLHAEEAPGMVVAGRLVSALTDADRNGAVAGEIVVVPAANPTGLDQLVLGRAQGRFELAGGGNFNRHYPELTDAAAARIGDALTDDAEHNVALIRGALMEALQGLSPVAEADRLRHALLELAIDADFVLDLHCDNEALVHLYIGTPLWPGAKDLARLLGAETVLLAEVSGDEPFDEACSSPWWRLPRQIGQDKPVPAACLATTIELRGMLDVEDGLAERDADALMRFLVRRGLVDGDPGALPPAVFEATPLAGVDMVTAPDWGVVLHRVALGDRVDAGQVVAELIDPTAENTIRRPLCAQVAGRVFARRGERLARPGSVVAKIAGSEPIADRGDRLLTP